MMNESRSKEIKILNTIMEDVGRLSKIESALEEDGENITLYNRIEGIELRSYELVNLLLSIKKILIILSFIIGTLLIAFLMK